MSSALGSNTLLMRQTTHKRRSHSNHKCCYDARYRSHKTRHLTESTPSSSTSGSSHRKRDISSSDSQNDSSGYGCSHPKTSRTDNRGKRHRGSSHVSQRKVKRSRADPSKTIRSGSNCESSRRLNVDRSHPFRSERDTKEVGIERRRRRSRSEGSQTDGRRDASGRNGYAEQSHHVQQHHPRADSGDRHRADRREKREYKRLVERDRRKESHAKHWRKELAVVPIGDTIKRRYEVRKILGEGSFGQVLDCIDLHTQKLVAVKVLKRLDDHKVAAAHELEVLVNLAKLDKTGSSNCINVLDFFDWRGSYFISFPLLGSSVFQFLEANEYAPYPIEQVASISAQLCDAVNFMHSCRLAHTDIKPENILFVNDAYDEIYDDKLGRPLRVVRDSTIKVIDFGSATYDNEHHPTIIQTRHYRAPEVVLELGWSFPADVWSIGCIIYELVTGDCLFMTHDNLQHLAMMERFLGPLPRNMIRKSRCRRYFHKCKLDWDPEGSDGCYVRKHVKPLADIWFASSDMYKRLSFDLIKEMLYFDPHQRITASKALEHPFTLSSIRASM